MVIPTRGAVRQEGFLSVNGERKGEIYELGERGVDCQVYCVECQELSEQTGNEGFIYTVEQPYYVLYGMFSHPGARGWVRLGRLGPADAQP